MKIGISTYSFIKLIQSGSMTQLDCIYKTKEMGFDEVEIAGVLPHDNSSIKEYAEKIAVQCSALDLPISNYAIAADFLNGGEDWAAEADRLGGEVDVAEILGAKRMRHDATQGYAKHHRRYRGFDAALPILIKGCRAVTEYAATKGIRTMVENHGYFCQDSSRVEKLVNGVAHENFGLLLDMGNFLCADEPPELAFGRLVPYAFHIHVKDFHVKSGNETNPGVGFFQSRAGNYLRGAVIGHGDVPVVQCLGNLKRSGYEETISIEFEGIEEPLTAIQIGLDNLRRFIELA